MGIVACTEVEHPFILSQAFAPTVSGKALSEPFSVSLDQSAPDVTVRGLPRDKRVSASHPAVVYVKVRNTGTAPEAYFIDGRLNSMTQYSLPSLTPGKTTVPLSVFGNIPYYLIPSETASLVGTAATTGTEPIQFDLGAPTGDPDIASGQGLSAVSYTHLTLPTNREV